MSWGEFGIFISQNYSWLGNSCSQHTWIKANYETGKNWTTKKAFPSRLQVCLLGEMCQVWMFQWLRVHPGCSSTSATARRTRSSWRGGGWKSRMRKTSRGDNRKTFFVCCCCIWLRTDRNAEQKDVIQKYQNTSMYIGWRDRNMKIWGDSSIIIWHCTARTRRRGTRWRTQSNKRSPTSPQTQTRWDF